MSKDRSLIRQGFTRDNKSKSKGDCCLDTAIRSPGTLRVFACVAVVCNSVQSAGESRDVGVERRRAYMLKCNFDSSLKCIVYKIQTVLIACSGSCVYVDFRIL